MISQEIPREIEDAFQTLVEAGFTKHLLAS